MRSNDFETEALDCLIPNYRKLLMVNLTTFAYKPIVIPDDEWNLIQDKNFTICDYWEWFANSELIFPEDKEMLIEFANVADAGKHICYRRLMDGVYKWVLMQIIPTVNYSTSNKECMLYVKDIHDIYSEQYESVVDKIGTTDTFTGLYNKLGFTRDCSKHKSTTVGIVYADLNGLKKTNDELGHKAGDELIMKFANLLRMNFKKYRCYHLSGDEFVVLSFDGIREFLSASMSFHKSMWEAMNVPMASIGYSCGMYDELSLVLQEAEKAMYDDKRLFYVRFPEYRRK